MSDEGDESFLAFVIVLHLGTALALLAFYWSDWVRIVRALVLSIVRGRFTGERDEKLGWLLIAGTIPVGILGVLFQSSVRGLFASPIPVAIFLMINAFIMFAGEWLRRRQAARSERTKPIERVTWLEGVGVRRGGKSLALLAGYFALGLIDRRRPAHRSRSRRCGQLFVLARDARDSACGAAGDPGNFQTGGRRDTR